MNKIWLAYIRLENNVWFLVFNADIYDLHSDTEKDHFKVTEETSESDMNNESKDSFSVRNWEETAIVDFNFVEF